MDLFPVSNCNMSSPFPLDNLLFPSENSLSFPDILNTVPSRPDTPIPEEEDYSSLSPVLFAAFEAIPSPILVLCNETLNIVYANSLSLYTFNYSNIYNLPLYRIFPSWNFHENLRAGMNLSSVHSISSKGLVYYFDVSVGSLPVETASGRGKKTFWVLTLQKSQENVPVSRYHTEFEEIRCIGNGGFGRVYHAKNRIDGQEYAIKKVKINVNMEKLLENTQEPSKQQLLLREVKTFASLSNHPNVLRYYNAWIEPWSSDSMDDSDDEAYETPKQSRKKSQVMERKNSVKRKGKGSTIYIQMQLCQSSDLRTFIQKRTTIQPLENIEIIWQILSGLAHVHAQGIVHRDIKPENIFIEGDKVFLGDFGLAKTITSSIKSRHSSYNPEEGTYIYMSPEISAEQNCSTKADIYSFGIMFLELYSSFETGMERAMVLKKVKETGILPTEVLEKYPEEARLIQKCISSDADSRPSANELMEESLFLDGIMSKSPFWNYQTGLGTIPEDDIVPSLKRRSSVLSNSGLTVPQLSSLFTHLAHTRKFSEDLMFSPSPYPTKSPILSKSMSDVDSRPFGSTRLRSPISAPYYTPQFANLTYFPYNENDTQDDIDPKEKIKKLEHDVKELMHRLEVSKIRERQLEEELEFILGHGQSVSESSDLFISDEVEHGQAIPIPKRK